MVLARVEMNLTNFPNGFFQSVGLLACTTRLLFLLLGRLVQAHLRKCIGTKNCIWPPSQKRFTKDRRKCVLLCATLFR